MEKVPNIVRVIKSRIMRLTGHVLCKEERRGVYRVVVGRPKKKRPLERPKRGWEDNINTLRTGDADLRFYVTTVQDG